MQLTDLFLSVIDLSVAASWVALVVLGLRFALKKAPRWITVALWALVAVRLICPVSFESPFSVVSVEGAQDTVADMLDSYMGPSNAYWDIHEEYKMAVDAGIEPIHGGEGNFYVVTGETPTTKAAIVADRVAYVWIAGMTGMLAHALISYWKLRRKVSASIQLKDGIYLCDYIDTPFILGILAPKIYLPSSMDPDHGSHVLAHERAHLKRRDHWWKPLGFLLLTVHWFNPVLWLAYVLLCRDIEMACDEKVVREMTLPDKKAYSEALLRCSVSRRMIAACPLAFGEVGVGQRVKSVLTYKKPAFWVVLLAVLALIIAGVCLLTDPVTPPNGQKSYDMTGSNVSDIDTLAVLEKIRRYTGMEDHENAYVNSKGFDILLKDNFDFASTSVQYFFHQDRKTYSSILIFVPYADSFTLLGTEEWEEQETLFLLHHYLEALRCLPQEEIRAMAPAERYLVSQVEEGTPGSYDRVIRYSSEGVGPTDGWYIHLEVTPMYRGEDGEYLGAEDEKIDLFYGDGKPDVNGVIMDAKILEIDSNAYLVEPVPGSWELNSASQIWVPMQNMAPSPEPLVGDIIRITYDGQLMETYPAQIGEVFRIQVVAHGPLGEEIVHFNEAVCLSIQIPEGWEYERINSAGDGYRLTIRFRPEGEEGWVSLNCQSEPFAVCGTGLVTNPISLAGHQAIQGSFDDRNIWSYILLQEELPGEFVILNDGADEWLHDAYHHAAVWKMLDTVQISEGIG